MPEAWERRVRDLARVPAPVDRMWERVTRGPRPDPGPSPRRRFVAAIVAAAVFGSSALLIWSAFRPARQASVGSGGSVGVVSIRTPDQTGGDPSATLSIGRWAAQASLDEYLWDGDRTHRPFPPTISRSVRLEPGTILEFLERDRPERTSLFLADPVTFVGIEGTEIVVRNSSASLPTAPPGAYILVIQQSWGCRFASPTSEACFEAGAGSERASLLTFYFGITIAA